MGRVVKSYDPGSVTRGTACLTSVCIQGDLNTVICGEVGRVVGTTFLGWRGVLGGLEEPWNMWLRARRRVGNTSGMFSRR
jgi:hypothetical protein